MSKQHAGDTWMVHTHQDSCHIVWKYFCRQGKRGGHRRSKPHSVDGPHYKAQSNERGSCGNPIEQSARQKNQKQSIRVKTGIKTEGLKQMQTDYFGLPQSDLRHYN